MARILVTGGTAGIGQAVVAQLIAEGHSVIATSRHQQTASAQIEWHQLDLGSQASVHQFCQSTLWDTPIDGVFNNAGFGLLLQSNHPQKKRSASNLKRITSRP